MNNSGLLIRESSFELKKAKRHRQETLWTHNQQQIYIEFLRGNYEKMISHEERKKYRVFKMISKLLGTRTPIQVKSHHQKLQSKYKTITNIIRHLQTSYSYSMMKMAQKMQNHGVSLSVGIQVDFEDEKERFQALNSLQFASFDIDHRQYYEEELRQWSFSIQDDEFSNIFYNF